MPIDHLHPIMQHSVRDESLALLLWQELLKFLSTSRLPILERRLRHKFKIAYLLKDITAAAIDLAAAQERIATRIARRSSFSICQISINHTSNNDIANQDIIIQRGCNAKH